jgi:hypothetical protein
MPIVSAFEIVDQAVYDTLYLLVPRAGLWRSREIMFSIPIGQNHMTDEGWRPKTAAETNLYLAGAMDSAQKMAVRAIRCVFLGRKILPCSSRYYAATHLSLIVNQKTCWQGPAWKCADPVTMVVSPDTFLALGRHQRVDLIRSLRRELRPKVAIESDCPFSVQVDLGRVWNEFADDAPDRLMVMLEGNIFRPII